MKNILRFLSEGPGGAPRDFETIRRSFLRKYLGLDKRSSAPLISGDTFKYLSDIIFEGDQYDFPKDLENISGKTLKIFVQGWPVSNAANELAAFCKTGLDFSKAILIIHNCDMIPSETQMKVLASKFGTVLSVNWLGDPTLISPLPIGLENRDKRRNGVPNDYLRLIKKGLPTWEARDINFLICFSLHTNESERKIALAHASSLPGSIVVSEAITPKQYRKLLLRSKYVISPPGNGPDCHRTWEALYLGAIPVVKESSWPFRHLDLPVIKVQGWEELSDFHSWEIPSGSTEWSDLDFWLKDFK